MAHPKHRTSKQRRNKRRTHDAITEPLLLSVLTVVLLYSIIQYVLNVDITEESWLLRKQ